jgi:hypothetical protein
VARARRRSFTPATPVASSQRSSLAGISRRSAGTVDDGARGLAVETSHSGSCRGEFATPSRRTMIDHLDEVTMMTDFRTAKILSHRRNIQRYGRLLATELTEFERQSRARSSMTRNMRADRASQGAARMRGNSVRKKRKP